MEGPALTTLKEIIIQTVNECMDPEILDLVYKLLSFL